MFTKSALLNHAGIAVERTERSLVDMRSRLQKQSAAALGRQHRLLIDGALHDLTRRHEVLTRLYEVMISAPEETVPECWQRFFVCYDDYLEAVRDIRCRLIQDERDSGDQAVAMHGSRRNGEKK